MAEDRLVVHDVRGKHAVFVRGHPGSASGPVCQVFGVIGGPDAIADADAPDVLADSEDLTGGVVADYSVGNDRPGVSSITYVGITPVERHGVDFDQDGRWCQALLPA